MQNQLSIHFLLLIMIVITDILQYNKQVNMQIYVIVFHEVMDKK